MHCTTCTAFKAKLGDKKAAVAIAAKRAARQPLPSVIARIQLAKDDLADTRRMSARHEAECQAVLV